MGLDQYAFTVGVTLPQPIDFAWPENAEVFHYWRKHHDLQDWMERRYLSKGGDAEKVITSLCMQLEKDDIKQLCRDVMDGLSPPSGAYLPGRDIDEERAHDLSFIAKAILALARGETIIYLSGW